MLCIGLTTVSIHLESHDASPGLSEHPGQFPGTPSCLQSCKPTLHLRGKKGREREREEMGGEKKRREREREEMGGGKKGREREKEKTGGRRRQEGKEGGKEGRRVTHHIRS